MPASSFPANSSRFRPMPMPPEMAPQRRRTSGSLGSPPRRQRPINFFSMCASLSVRGGQNAPLHALYYPIQWEGPSRKFLGQWVNGGVHRFIHKKFTGRSRFCRNYPLSYACTKRNDLPLFSPSPFFKHTQAEDPDPTPVRVFCRLAPSSSFLRPSASLVKGRWHGRSP